jgi:hypothetical protein
MRRLLVLCIVSFSLTGGCTREKTLEGDGRRGAESELVRDPLDVSPTAPVRTGYATETIRAARRASRFDQETATASPPVPVPQDRKLIREGRATLEVVSVDATLARLHDLTRQAGGYTTSETRSRDDQREVRARSSVASPPTSSIR